MADLKAERPAPKASGPFVPGLGAVVLFFLEVLLPGADLDSEVANFNGLARPDFAALTQLYLAVDSDRAGAHQGFARAAALADAQGLQQLKKFDVGFF